MPDIETAKSFSILWRQSSKVIFSFIIVIILIIAGELLVPGFSSEKHVLMLIKVASFLGFFGLAQAIVIISGDGGIDLSVGAVASIGAVVGATILQGNDGNLLIGFVLVAALGFAIGIINGLMISYLQIPPLIMTLAMSSVVNGSIYIYSRGLALPGSASPLLKALSNATTLGIPNIIFVWIGVILISMLILHYTKTGTKLYGVGANEIAAILKGVDVKRFRVLVYATSGLISALTGFLLLGYIGTAFLDIGRSYLFPSIAAVAIGGISIQGGEGNYMGVVGGALVLTVLGAILVSMQMGEAGRQVVFGVILIILLTLYGRERKGGSTLM